MSDVSESSACTASFSVFHITAPAFNKIYYSHTLENAIFSMKAMLGQTLDYIFVRPEMLKQITG